MVEKEHTTTIFLNAIYGRKTSRMAGVVRLTWWHGRDTLDTQERVRFTWEKGVYPTNVQGGSSGPRNTNKEWK